MTNIAYLLGADGVTFNQQTRSFQPISRATTVIKKNRIHVNKILPTIQNRLARLCKNPPKYDVRPESNDTEDKEASRLSLQILSTMWEKLTLNQKRIGLYMWVQQCGHAWMKVSWDPTLGKFMPGMMDELTGEESPSAYEGDVRADVTSPFEIFPNPQAKSEDEVLESWLIQCKLRKLDYFKAQYPEKGELVKEEDAWLMSVQYDQRINSINTKNGGTAGSTQQSIKNSAIEMIKYEARSAKYPNGRMIVCANGILLENKELPVGEIPFRMFCDVMVGGKLFPESTITHLRPIQDQYNENARRRSEWSKKLLAGKYAAPRGSGLAQEAMNDESGEIVYYDPIPTAVNGGVPTPIQVPNMPQWVFQEEDRLDSEFNEISGISEVSKGTLPSASIPAIGMQLLTEQDDTRIGVMTEQHEQAWAGVGSLILKYVEKYYIIPRKIKIAGKNLQYTVKEVSGQDLRGNTDVIVIRGSTLPGSKTLRRQEIINLHQQGYLGNPQDPKVLEKVLGMLEYGDVGEAWQDYGLDMAQIDKGIKILESGQPIHVDENDNHALWVQELNRYRKGDKFDTLPPEVQLLVKDTITQHIDWIVELTSPPEQAPPPPVSDPLVEALPDQPVEGAF